MKILRASVWPAILIGMEMAGFFTVTGAEPTKAPVPQSPYIAVVYRYADTLLERGRDTFGPQKTGLFLGALDRVTLEPLTNRPPAPAGVRELDRCGTPGGPLTGANLQHDENLLRLLYLLTDLTTKPKYREAADGALRWFFENAAVDPTPPWGGRGFWDTMSDQPVVAAKESSLFFRPWMLAERTFGLAPGPSRTWALRLRDEPMPPTPQRPRHLGCSLRSWAAAYHSTKDAQFLKAIEAALPPTTGRGEGPQGAKVPPSDMAFIAALSLAIDYDGSALLLPEPLASRLRALAAHEDESFESVFREVAFRKIFHDAAPTGGLAPRERRWGDWTVGAADWTTARMALLCVSRYDNRGRTIYLQVLTNAASAYLDSVPGVDEDVWPAAFGHAISLQLAAWRHTANAVYLQRARIFADLAIARLFGSSPLPRASVRSEHYESLTGADTLALALAELHFQVLHITAVRCPLNTIDR
jgi:hypothetical protein